MSENKVVCGICPHHCAIYEGGKGKCRARGTRNGKNVPLLYGIMSSVALDPIEKKPLRRFYPGSTILSVGSFGCSLNCPICRNGVISMTDGSAYLRDKDSHYQYILDTAPLLREKGLKTVLRLTEIAREKLNYVYPGNM